MTDFYDLSPEEQANRLQAMAARALEERGINYRAISLIKYRENAVFRVDTATENILALRIHRPGYHTDAELHSELQWMKALAGAGIDVPEVIATGSNDLFTVVETPGVPEPRQIDLFAWIEGRQLGSVEGGLNDHGDAVHSTYRVIGELAARLHNQAAHWTLPPGFTRHAWDAEGLVGDEPLWGRFWELEALTDGQRELLLSARERVRRELGQYGKKPARYSLIHADFSPENLIVDGENVKLIDFDDAGFGWHLFELATALYFIQSEPYFETARDALVEGYREYRDLPDEELAELPLFMLARGFTYLGWVHTRPETETAREFTPVLIEMACSLARDYLERQ
ncbi:MAG: phosphotransferase [Gammaproteobacteria bacterium]